MAKKDISPEKAKFISTLLISIIFMTIILSLSRMYTKKMLKEAEEDYFNSINTMMDGFTRIVSIQLHGYIFSLQTFYNDKVFDNCDTNEIVNFIKYYDYKKHEDFEDLYYITPDGKTFFSNANTLQLTPEKHLGLYGKCFERAH